MGEGLDTPGSSVDVIIGVGRRTSNAGGGEDGFGSAEVPVVVLDGGGGKAAKLGGRLGGSNANSISRVGSSGGGVGGRIR